MTTPADINYEPPPPIGPEDWARAWLVHGEGFAYPVIDGRRVTLAVDREFRTASSELYDVWLLCCWMAQVPDEVQRRLVLRREAALLVRMGESAVSPELVRKAAGYDIVARDPRPATCPTCGSDNWRWPDRHSGYLTHPCPDPWHGEGR